MICGFNFSAIHFPPFNLLNSLSHLSLNLSGSITSRQSCSSCLWPRLTLEINIILFENAGHWADPYLGQRDTKHDTKKVLKRNFALHFYTIKETRIICLSGSVPERLVRGESPSAMAHLQVFMPSCPWISTLRCLLHPGVHTTESHNCIEKQTFDSHK